MVASKRDGMATHSDALFIYVGDEGQWDSGTRQKDKGKRQNLGKPVSIGVGNVWNGGTMRNGDRAVLIFVGELIKMSVTKKALSRNISGN